MAVATGGAGRVHRRADARRIRAGSDARTTGALPPAAGRGSVGDGRRVNAGQQHALDASSSVSCDAMVRISRSFFPYAPHHMPPLLLVQSHTREQRSSDDGGWTQEPAVAGPTRLAMAMAGRRGGRRRLNEQPHRLDLWIRCREIVPRVRPFSSSRCIFLLSSSSLTSSLCLCADLVVELQQEGA
jgi:hypothetical protein